MGIALLLANGAMAAVQLYIENYILAGINFAAFMWLGYILWEESK